MGPFKLNDIITHSIRGTLQKTKCVTSPDLHIPMKLTFKNYAGKSQSIFKSYQIKINDLLCKSQIVKKDSFALSGPKYLYLVISSHTM